MLQFQPIVSLRGDARQHYETLVRLPRTTAGELLPADFFGPAKASGLISAVDHWVIRQAIRRLARERATNRRIHLFVPLSTESLADSRLLLTICDELRESQAEGDWLTFQFRPEDIAAHRSRTRQLADGLENVPGRTGCNIDPATLVRLVGIPNMIGVKEASGNISQMADICHSVPDDFIVMSGDDAITLPFMALGGHGIISVASNEVPAEMVQMVEAFERGALAEARHWHNKLLPLMQINFVESNPGPVKFAMAAMGHCEEVFRLQVVSPRPAAQEKILAVLRDLGLPIVGAVVGGRA